MKERKVNILFQLSSWYRIHFAPPLSSTYYSGISHLLCLLQLEELAYLSRFKTKSLAKGETFPSAIYLPTYVHSLIKLLMNLLSVFDKVYSIANCVNIFCFFVSDF